MRKRRGMASVLHTRRVCALNRREGLEYRFETELPAGSRRSKRSSGFRIVGFGGIAVDIGLRRRSDGNGIVLLQPATQIDEPATIAAKRPGGPLFRPLVVHAFVADRTGDAFHRSITRRTSCFSMAKAQPWFRFW